MSGGYRTMDVTQIVNNLGDKSHGLRTSKMIELVGPSETGGALPDRIHRASFGHASTVSTCTALVPLGSLRVGDPNCYYRDLGFTWPRRGITKKQLRKAYQRKRGYSSERLTYCLKQLLNPAIRAKYDARAMGDVMGDKYTEHQLKREAAQWAARRSAETKTVVSADDFLEQELGIKPDEEGDSKPEKHAPEQLLVDDSWPFDFYQYKSRKYDEGPLSEWQCMLIEAFSAQGLSMQLAVGYCGDTPESWIERNHSSWSYTSRGRIDETIIFLNESVTPSKDLAEAVASSFSSHQSKNTLSPKDTSMTTATPEADLSLFRRGGAQAEANKEAQDAARRASRSKTEYLTSLLKKKGDTVIIRFITDEPEWPEVAQHNYIPTKAAPEGKPADVSWPPVSGAVCRKSEKHDGTTFYNDCYICDFMRDPTKNNKPYSRGTRLWALACIRKEVLGTEEMVKAGQIKATQVGRRVGFVDDTVEYDEVKDGKATGVKLKRKRIVIVNYSMQNFFSQFITFANEQLYGTVLDRDYLITRKGEEIRDVDYVATPMDVIMKPIRNEAGEVIGTEPFDLREPKFRAAYEDHGINLAEMIKHRMSDEFYNRYFDPRVTVKWSDRSDDDDDSGTSGSAAAQSSPVSEPTSGPTSDLLAKMRDKVMANNQGKAASEEEPAQSEPVAAAEPAQTAPAPETSVLVDFS